MKIEKTWKRYACLSLVALVLCASGCSECEDGLCTENYGVNPEFSVTRAPLTAYCNIAVEGYGSVAMETDYVPNVTWCENGNAPDQALRAQAVSARTFGYYKIKSGGTPVKNSQGDQVYKCESRSPSTAQLNRCKEAANDTSGRVLTYKNTMTAGFYVSGVVPKYLNSECKFTGNSSSTGWVGVQTHVTYNWGKTGDNVQQTSLGWINSKNYANRGCMAQNGATCLANAGWQWENISRFFYGSDINIEQATGTCVEEKKCETTLSKSGTIIDDQDACFSRSASNSWYDVSGGHNGHLYYTYVWDKAAEAIGTWTVNVTRAGTYEVFAYIQSGVGAVSEKAPYTIRASGKETKVSLNLNGKSGWVSLGKFTFASGGDQWVKLSDASGEAYTDKNGKRVLFDAIKFEDAVICTDACTAGAKQCSENGVQTCQKGSNGCTVWSATTACGSNQICKNGACVASCSDACTEGAKQCSGNGVQTCQKGSNGCTTWSSPVDCGSQVCDKGACVTTCTDGCEAEGMRECSGAGYRICGEHDNDGCLEWSEITACGDTEMCTHGVCEPLSVECQDECTAGEGKCDDAGAWVCGQHDNDTCLEWPTEPQVCADGEVCMDGVCQTNEGSWSGDIDGIPAECLTEVDGRPSTIIDDLDPCFVREVSSHWSELSGYGHNNHLYYAYVTDGMPSAVGTWNLKVTKSGKYTIYAYIESGVGNVSNQAPYEVRASGKSHHYGIDLEGQSGWFKVGDYDLTAGVHQYVRLMDASGEVYEENNGKRLVFDAIQVVPYGTSIDGEAETDDGKPSDKPDQGDENTSAGDGSDTDDDQNDQVEENVQYVSDDCAGTPQNLPRHAPLGLLACALAALGLLRRRSLSLK